jgi:hypothetical protein
MGMTRAEEPRPAPPPAQLEPGKKRCGVHYSFTKTVFIVLTALEQALATHAKYGTKRHHSP